ncbi:MAG TPA: hypothetical protein VFW98_05045 [Gemmatimonadaceae bacterium]|nr:hypothetical protein [Gemmatimonadaceae bacterium]
MSETDPASPSTAPAQETRRERLRFSDFTFRRTSDGRCSADVELEWVDGVVVHGSATGQSSPTVDLRVAAEAALRAIESFADGALSFELIGAKAIKAFDATVIIVSVANRRAEGPRRLLGAYLAEEDPVRGAVLAVLSATNRVLGNFIVLR